jgi:hypothetical protein
MKLLNNLDAHTNYWFTKSMLWMDKLWDAEMALCHSPTDRIPNYKRPPHHTVRDTVWYATGLFIRQADGDIARAHQAIEAIMTYQFDEPEAVYHGTFYRAPQEPPPPENPQEWRDYDPNWREFICSVFIILLAEYDELLPNDLQQKMRHAIHLASQGAYARKVRAEYTNISLMSAFLLDYAGRQFDIPEWQAYALEQAHKIQSLFSEYQTFYEYNSPTYYGVDLYALALWRKYGATDDYRTIGATLEAELWRDIAQFYHADMYNVCGPYDRSYGMDMRDYVAVVGLWIAAVLPPTAAPLPNVDVLFNHSGDFFFVPLIALVDVQMPDDVRTHFTTFQGERYLERTIEPNRTAQAWLSQQLMLGASSDQVNAARSDQYHPATAHWLTSNHTVGWIRTRSAALIQASIKPNTMQLWGTESEPYDYVFEICATDATPDMIQAHQWTLPNLTVSLQRPDTPYTVRQEGESLMVAFTSDEAITLSFQHHAD